jgi:hypothetical protein
MNRSKVPFHVGIRKLLTSYRVTPANGTGKSPAQLLFSYEYRAPFQVVRRSCSKEKECKTVDSQCKGEAKSACQLESRFCKGQVVLVKRPGALKGYSPYIGPFKITEVLGMATYRLSDGKVWNARRIKAYRPQTPLQVDFENTSTYAPDRRPPLRRSARPNKGIPPVRYRGREG